MKIEIWSDVMCPFCYIGKRRFENALNQLPFKDEVEIEWKAFQLDPSIQNEPGKNIHQYLAERKGFSLEKARELNDHVTGMAKSEGLQYNFDKAVVANSFDAHRFAQVAKKNGKGIEAEESLFKAYFTEGKDISNHDTLVQLGQEIGLDGAVVKKALESDAYTKEVKRDIAEAEELAIRGVPFFVIDRKYAVSGAQATETFIQALNQSYTEWKNQNTQLKTIDGEVCSTDGDCK